MGANDVLEMMSPYLLAFLCILLIVCCFMRSCHCGMSAHELREIRERHDQEIRENRMRIRDRLEMRRQIEQERIDDHFAIENINRLDLTDALTKYTKYLKQKIKEEREREEMEEDIVIFINPGNEKPVLGNLIKNDNV